MGLIVIDLLDDPTIIVRENEVTILEKYADDFFSETHMAYNSANIRRIETGLIYI